MRTSGSRSIDSAAQRSAAVDAGAAGTCACGAAFSATAASTALANFGSLDITERDRLSEGGQGIPRGHELVRHIALESRGRNRRGHRAPIDLLCVVELVPAGNAAGVEVRAVLLVVSKRSDEIAFHDLHVIEAGQHLHSRL